MIFGVLFSVVFGRTPRGGRWVTGCVLTVA